MSIIKGARDRTSARVERRGKKIHNTKMTSNWTQFRKIWLKPEVYPLIGSMVAALGVCGAAMLNKATDPTVTWNKQKRSDGAPAQIEDVDEVVPMWASAKGSSIRIFGKENPIMQNKKSFTQLEQDTFVMKAPVDEEEEEEEEPVAVADDTVVESAAAEIVKEAKQVLEVMDEAAETIKAAVDEALGQGMDAINDTAAS